MKKRIKIYIFFLLAVAVFFTFFIFVKAQKVKSVEYNNLISQVRESAKSHSITFSSIEITKDNDIKAVYNNINILFSTQKNLEDEVISLQKVLKSTKIGSAKEIDFRFNKIVIR